jgi:hypothetical protein
MMMKKFLLTAFALSLSIAGFCAENAKDTAKKPPPPIKAICEKPKPPPPIKAVCERPKPTATKGIKTAEIIRILEKEQISSIGTSHAQTIYIGLKDGRRYKGKYVPKEAGKYAKISDILNLVVHIKKTRPKEETKGWAIMCE